MSNQDRESSRSSGRDAALDRAWQQASDEQPSAQLDAAIVEAAHRAVEDRHEQGRGHQTDSRSRTWLTRWQPLAAAAMVAGLAFVLVQSLPRERADAPSMRIEEAAPGPATTQEQPRSPSARPATDETSAASPPVLAGTRSTVTATGRERAKQAAPPPGAAGPAASQAPAATGATASQRDNAGEADDAYALRATEAERRNAATSKMATGVAAAGVTATAAQESRQVDAAPSSAADRSAEIAALYAAGNVTGAADALRALRAEIPDADAYLPESLREWARTVE